MLELRNLIGGALCESSSGAWRDSINPATGQAHARYPDSVAADIDRTVASAHEAFPEWSAMPAAARAGLLCRLADLIDANREQLARLESIDQGKVLTQAMDIEIPRSAANFRFFAGAVQHASGDFHDMGQTALNYTLRRPRGVVGCISPWNLPLYLFTWKIAPALATGNTVVGKPSEVTPATASRLGELAIEAGLPPGVLNIVHGDGAVVGQRLVEHPDVGTLTFTGGTATGARIASTAGPMFKRVSLELGGKNPVIVCEDADLERAMPHIVRSAFSNQGEICLCGSRILVHRARLSEFMEAFTARVAGLKVGDPLDSESDMGALVSQSHLEHVESYIELAREEGGKIAVGGGRPRTLPEQCRAGAFLEPTVVLGLPQDCRTNQEEIFGPVVSVQGFDTHGEAIRRANDVRYGLACSIWTDDLTRAHRMAAKIDAGIVWVNCWMIRDLRTPFGGWKYSGVGREGGEEALHFFTEATNVCIGLES